MRSEAQKSNLIGKDAQRRRREGLNRRNREEATTSHYMEESSEEEEYFEVESILDMKISRNGKRQFFVSLRQPFLQKNLLKIVLF